MTTRHLTIAIEAEERPRRYTPWENAGGPNECEHGYAEGIPCERCDVDAERKAAR